MERIRVPTRGRQHEVLVFDIGPDIWSVECPPCRFVAPAFSEEHLHGVLEQHLAGEPDAAAILRSVLDEER